MKNSVHWRHCDCDALIPKNPMCVASDYDIINQSIFSNESTIIFVNNFTSEILQLTTKFLGRGWIFHLKHQKIMSYLLNFCGSIIFTEIQYSKQNFKIVSNLFITILIQTKKNDEFIEKNVLCSHQVRTLYRFLHFLVFFLGVYNFSTKFGQINNWLWHWDILLKTGCMVRWTFQ